MGVLEKAAMVVAKAATKDVRYEALGKAAEITRKIEKATEGMGENRSEKQERKYQKFKAELLSKNPDNCHLMMAEKITRKNTLYANSHHRSEYIIADMDDRTKYFAYGNREDHLQRVKLCDANNKVIGEIIEQPFAFRNPFEREYKPADYTIKIFGNKVGEIKTARSEDLGDKMELDFIDWNVSKSFNEVITITDDDGNIIGEVKGQFWGHMTGFDFKNPKDEVLMILLALVYDANQRSRNRKPSY